MPTHNSQFLVSCHIHAVLSRFNVILCIFIDPPEILEGPTNVTAEIGGTVTFCCNVTGFPEPTVTWQLDGMAINKSNSSIAQSKYNQSRKEGMHVITITDVQLEEDGGRYSCHFENDVGKELQSAYLQIQGTIQVQHSTNVVINVGVVSHCLYAF